jgi:hypothetical protein
MRFPTALVLALLCSSLLLLALPTQAGYGTPPVTVSVEPIIGYERVQKLVPQRHTRDRLTYGARARAGIPAISAELEYTRAEDTEDFSNQPLTRVKDQDDRLKLGIVSSYSLSTLLSFQARAGGQASRGHHEETVSGATSATDRKLEYNPYAGGGLTARLGDTLDLSAGITVVFHEFPDMSKNDYQTTLGFSVKFGAR